MAGVVGEQFAKCWRDNIEKEDKLRLDWFRKNENTLVEETEKPLQKAVGPEVHQERIENFKQLFQEVEKFPIIEMPEPAPRDFDPDCLLHIMRPVEPDVKQLLYTGYNKDGRENYLHERVKVIPERKYYFPETTSFRYGWKMWDHAKETEAGPRFGRSQIIKQSFYRRRGTMRDPDWYQTPERLSPTICDCS